MELFNGGVPVVEVLERWLEQERGNRWGAMLPFVGIVRPDQGIEGLYFELYAPLLVEWFSRWERVEGVKIYFAHSFGEVPVGESSFVAAVFSTHREEGFRYLREFVEDFKAKAPIWKYDLKNGEKIFLKERGKPLPGAGILGEEE